MSFEEEFDRIIRQKAEHADFPFDGKNWEKAAAMLDGQKAVTGLPVWKKAIVPTLLGIAAITALVVMLPSDGNKQTAQSSTQNTTAIENKTDNIALNSNLPSNENPLPTNSKTTPSENVLNQATRVAAPKASVPATQKLAPVNPKTEEVAAVNYSATQVSANPDNVRTPKPTSSTPKEVHASTANQSADHGAVSLPPIDNTDNTTVDNVINNKDEEPEHSINPPVADERANNSNDLVLQALPAEPSKVTPDAVAEITEGSAISESAAIFWLPTKSLLLEMPQDNATVVSTFQMLPSYVQDDYVKKAPRYYLSALGGMHYAFGWETAAGKDGKGYNYFGGFEFGKYITANVTVGTGLQYFTFSNIYQPYYASIGKGYGFGYTQSYSGVTTDRINYLSIPLFVNYTSADGFMIGAGLTGNYLLSVHNRVDTYGISDGIKGAVKSEGNSNIYEGTKMFGMMANVRVGYTVFNRMNLFADIQYGLNDLFDAQTEKQTAEKITGLRFGLNYILIKK